MFDDFKKWDSIMSDINVARQGYVRAILADNTKEALRCAVKVTKLWTSIVDDLQVKHALEKTDE